jgi:Fuc2NAc and GlcNAc transferase
VTLIDAIFAAAAFAIALVTTRLVLRHAVRTNMIDVPSRRSSHEVPTPRGGGAGIVVAYIAAMVVLTSLHRLDIRLALALLGGGALMAFVGFLDDRNSLSARFRIVIHFIAAIWVVNVLANSPAVLTQTWDFAGSWIGRAAVVIGLVWVSNLFNFMDGIDGIAASEAVFALAAGACLHWYLGGDPGLTLAMILLAAATLGFLRWNWPPAKIFMGDVGSGFLGIEIGVFGLASSQSGVLNWGVWMILGGVFIVDATVTLLRRIWRGDRWFEPHRTHAYQHLARRWGSHGRVTAAVSVVNACWLFPLAWVAATQPRLAYAVLAVALAPLLGLAVLYGSGRRE